MQQLVGEFPMFRVVHLEASAEDPCHTPDVPLGASRKHIGRVHASSLRCEEPATLPLIPGIDVSLNPRLQRGRMFAFLRASSASGRRKDRHL